MKDFKSFKSDGDGAQNSFNGASGDYKNGARGGRENANGDRGENMQSGGVEQTVNLAAAMAKAFSGKSEGQIWQTILQQAEQGKRNGTLTNADLDNFYNALSPLVDGFRKQKLKQIIAKLKAI